jgi:hypothetical protein
LDFEDSNHCDVIFDARVIMACLFAMTYCIHQHPTLLSSS